MRSHLWPICTFGLRRWWRYCQARREGLIIDYAKVFTRDELAILEEHMESVPWR